MRPLSSLAMGLSLVSGFLFLALVAELYYLLWWQKRTPNRYTDHGGACSAPSPARELLYLFCWKKPNSLSSTALNPQQMCTTISDDDASNKDVLMPFGEEGMEAELMRLHSLSGPPRFLFTIKEETKEDLESEDGKSRRGRSLSGENVGTLIVESTPFMTPLSSPAFFTPPLTPLDCRQGFNHFFESGVKVQPPSIASPPPKFKFLRDAEEKLYKRTLKEEAMRVHMVSEGGLSSKRGEEEDGSFITIVIGKSKQQGLSLSSSASSSQINTVKTMLVLNVELFSATVLVSFICFEGADRVRVVGWINMTFSSFEHNLIAACFCLWCA